MKGRIGKLVEDGRPVRKRGKGKQPGGVVRVTKADGSVSTFYQTRSDIGKVVNAGQVASPPTLRVERSERAPLQQNIAPRVRAANARSASEAIELVRDRQRSAWLATQLKDPHNRTITQAVADTTANLAHNIESSA